MARGLILCCSQSRATSSVFTATRISPTHCILPFTCRLFHLHPHLPPPTTRCFCNSTPQQDPVDTSRYKEIFSRRMAMAGLKPHHRIALGVSGGPDSMALCVLAAAWKMNGLGTSGESGNFVDGLMAIVVDHGLRSESKDEANMVHRRVSEMGIRCEIAHCKWLDGKPKQGHLQEAARDKRYEIFQKVCVQNQIGMLLIAHHADDQAELFILRLSRNSGVLGLAGMPFTSQMFFPSTHYSCEISKHHGILLVRPLLEFSKEDMYTICRGGNQDWVEDPTNQSSLFARNRIRMSLRDFSSSIFRYELQAVISACRKTRSYVDHICCNLINRAVDITDQGYAIIDLEILNPSTVEDICLTKLIALVLQFISQRQRQIRGGASKLLLDYFRTFPCKTSLTAAGCYLCPSPGFKGTKALVCCSLKCPQPSRTEMFSMYSYEEQNNGILTELEQIIVDRKSYLDHLIPDASEVPFLDVSSEAVLVEAKRLNILSESTYMDILSVQKEETRRFKSKTEDTSNRESKHEFASMPPSEPLQPGEICYFMNRFFVSWNLTKELVSDASLEKADCDLELREEGWQCHCMSCVVGCDMVVEVRHMMESDWLYLAKLSKCQNPGQLQQQGLIFTSTTEQKNLCLDYARLSAQNALVLLKSIPAAARKSLPVLINHRGLLLGVPSICFRHCPCLMVSAEFKPRVPLGGGHSTFI